MDGTISDKTVDGRRLRPATQSYAASVYPEMILKLRQGKLQVSVSTSPDQSPVTLFSNSNDHYTITHEDFVICRSIASDSSIPLFATDTDSNYIDRIRALVVVRFFGRPQ
jgi:hypothetical protein